MPYRSRFSMAAWAAAALTATPAAFAADGLYVGGSVGATDQHFDAQTFDVHGSNTGYQVALGLRPIKLLAGEVDYVGFGRASGGVNYADTYGVGVAALGFLPIPLVDLYGRVGLMDFRTNANSPSLSFHRTGAALTYGVGAGMNWGPWGARVEYSRFNVPHTTSPPQLTSLGVVWSFL